MSQYLKKCVIGVGSVLFFSSAFASQGSTQQVVMTATTSVPALVTVNNFANASTTQLDAQLASGTLPTPITDSTSLSGFEVYSNTQDASNIAVTVSATNQGSNNKAILSNAANASTPITYHINYTPCGTGASSQDLTSCTDTGNPCTLAVSNASYSACQTTAGSGSYVFDAVTGQLAAGTYSGGTTLTFSVPLT